MAAFTLTSAEISELVQLGIQVATPIVTDLVNAHHAANPGVPANPNVIDAQVQQNASVALAAENAWLASRGYPTVAVPSAPPPGPAKT